MHLMSDPWGRRTRNEAFYPHGFDKLCAFNVRPMGSRPYNRASQTQERASQEPQDRASNVRPMG